MRRGTGFTVLEFLVAVSLSLTVVMVGLQLAERSRYAYVSQTDQAALQASGRTLITTLGIDLRNAGYSPLGQPLPAVVAGDGLRVRLLSDADADGRVLDSDGVKVDKDEIDDTVSYLFDDVDGDGVFELTRGADLDGDWDLYEGDDTAEVLHRRVVPLDEDADGTPEPFLEYDAAPPDATRVRVRFQLQAARNDIRTGEPRRMPFTAEFSIRNRRDEQ